MTTNNNNNNNKNVTLLTHQDVSPQLLSILTDTFASKIENKATASNNHQIDGGLLIQQHKEQPKNLNKSSHINKQQQRQNIITTAENIPIPTDNQSIDETHNQNTQSTKESKQNDRKFKETKIEKSTKANIESNQILEEKETLYSNKNTFSNEIVDTTAKEIKTNNSDSMPSSSENTIKLNTEDMVIPIWQDEKTESKQHKLEKISSSKKTLNDDEYEIDDMWTCCFGMRKIT